MKVSPIMTTEFSGNEITPEIVKEYLKRHCRNELSRLQMLRDYYMGEQSIMNRSKEDGLKNNRIMVNHALYIANFTSAYLVGEPVSYSSFTKTDISAVTDVLTGADSKTQDADLALDIAIFGRGYEMMYMSSDSVPVPKLARLSPLNTFVVYDDTVEQKPVFGVHCYPIYDGGNRIKKYKGLYCTENTVFEIEADARMSEIKLLSENPHFFGTVPINEFYNNGQRTGDFEGVIPEIDGYNTLLSDRVNDKEQFVDSLLLIKGSTMGDSEEEQTENYNAIKRNRVIEVAEGADAYYITRQFDESAVEILQSRITSDIHKISGVPDLSDENFAANASGVAMKYKLMGLEQIIKIKERYFTEGLKYRLNAIVNILEVKAKAKINVSDIKITFRRSLPVNEAEIAQTANMLKDIVPQSTLLSIIPAVEDVEKAVKELENEKRKSAENQRSLFMNSPIN